MLKGSMVALVTPMTNDGSLDQKALHRLLDMHLDQGTDGLVVCGTTGESVTLTEDEQYQLTDWVLEYVSGRIPVIIGTGTNATAKSIKLTERAKRVGADACLVVTPYYNKPTQEGLYQHYITIADAVDIPMFLYNVPGRTACDMLPETTERLSKHPNIIGIKEAKATIERAKAIASFCNDEFVLLSGDDKTALDYMFAGGKGVISVTANVAPKLMSQMINAALDGKTEEAKTIDKQLELLHEDLFVEANPIPVKWALHAMGMIEKGIRLPLTVLSEQYHEKVRSALRAANLLQSKAVTDNLAS